MNKRHRLPKSIAVSANVDGVQIAHQEFPAANPEQAWNFFCMAWAAAAVSEKLRRPLIMVVVPRWKALIIRYVLWVK